MKRTKVPEVAADVAPDETPARAEDSGRVIERPDGFYWQSSNGSGEYGPFTSLAEAELDMQSGGAGLESGDLHEAESELGISQWIDPDTGGPAEDSIPRLEDH